MVDFCSPIPCPPVPDNLSIVQFLLDSHLPIPPIRSGNTPWFIEDKSGRTIGFEEIRLRTHALANALHTRWGVGENDVVCIFSPNHVDYPVAIWAAHRVGAIVSCANPAYTTEELAHQLKTANAFVLISHPNSLNTALSAARQSGLAADHIVLMDELPSKSAIPFPTISDLVNEGLSKSTSFTERKLSPGESKTKLAFLSFSSGTTGKPKAVAIAHYSVVANIIQMCAFHKVNEEYAPWDKRRFRPGDIAIGVLPFFHIYGLVVNLHWLLFSGLTIVVIPRFNFVDFLKSIDRYKIQHLLLVPPQVVLLCKHAATKNYDLSHVRFCLSGAAPLSKELTEQLIKVIPNAEIGQGYGMTETCTTVSMIPITQQIGTPGSAGQLMPGCTARVVKADGSLADYEEEGELHITGPQMALGYTNDEKATEETFIDGWVRTGDEVKFSRNGDIFIVDRLKEILKVRGFQVAPAELEGHLLIRPDVTDVCVVGIPDDYSGEIPLAFVVLEAKAAEQAKKSREEANKIKEDLKKYVSDAKVQYKWLTGGVEFVDSIPKNPSGKLLRRLMRDKAKKVAARSGVKSKL